MSVSSSTAVLASAICTFAGAVFGQAQTVSTSQQGMNFYVTTPQTGEVVGSDGSQSSSVAVASANSRTAVNTYIQQSAPAAGAARRGTSSSTARQAVPSSAYSIQQVSNSPSSAYRSSARQQTASTSSRRQSSVATSAQTANYYYSQSGQQQQQQTNPAYVSNAGATAGKRSLLNRIIHPGHQHPQQAPAAKSTAESAWSKYKPSKMAGRMQQGVASWYGTKWHGRKTANGERYDMNSMTAAHKTLPFGTMVKVKNERNGRECVVRINNRGPFTKGRILDLSKAAASQLGMVSSGVAKVTYEVIGRS